ncbi:hypothetical protein OKW22_000752, partial [Bacilli bacterium PM5-3]|nr:hypothetical protein [Bacilli bacterium PM5-3]
MKKLFLKLMMVMFVVFGFNQVNAETVTDGDVKIDIPEYDSNVGWKPGDVKIAKINIDFKDATSNNKIIKIMLPTGLRYVSYPAKNPATSGDLASIEQETSGIFASNLQSSTSAVSLPYSDKSYQGEIIYNMKNTAETVEVTLTLTIDDALFYEDKTFSNDEAIKITALKNDDEIGAAKMDVVAKSDTPISFTIWQNGIANLTFLEGHNDLVNTNSVYVNRSGLKNNFCAKKVDFYYYYPISIGNINFSSANTFQNKGVVTNDITNGVINASYENKVVPTGYAFLSAVNFNISNAPIGVYERLDENNNREKHKAVLKTYDDKEIVVSGGSSPKFQIVDSSQASKKIDTYLSKKVSYNNVDSNYTNTIGYGFSNDNITIKKGYYIELTFDNNMQVEEIALPEIVKSFKYKTNQNDDYVEIDISKLTKTNSPLNKLQTFDNTKANLNVGEYVTNVIIGLSDINLGAATSGGVNSPLYAYENPRVLSKLKDGASNGNYSVKTYKLDENNEIIGETLTEVAGVMTKENLSSSFSRVINNVSIPAGSKGTVTADLNFNGFMYNNAQYMKNPAIYLRLPKNVNIDKDSVKITSSAVSGEIDFVVSDPYFVKNGDRYVEIDIKHYIGGFINLKAVRYMNISFDISAGLLSSGSYKWDKYAFIADKSNQTIPGVYTSMPSPIIDINDIDRDNDDTEKILPFLTNDLVIVPKKELLIDTYIKASATDSREADYDTSKPASAINFTPGTEAIYTVDIYNNRNDSAGTKAKTTAYIPVPKKGLNFGS